MSEIHDDLRRRIRERAAHGLAPGALIRELVGSGVRSDVAQAAVVHVLFERPEPNSTPEPLPAGPMTTIRTSDRTVRVLASMDSPRIVVFEDVMSPAECDALIALARPRVSPSTVIDHETGDFIPHPGRTSGGACIGDLTHPLLATVDRRLAELVHWPVNRGEGLQVLHYGPGQEYRPHFDYFDTTRSGPTRQLARGGNRIGTILVYLSTPAEGGNTVFPDVGLEIAPVQGHAVFFRYPIATPESRTLHGGRPVVRGEKWVATKWLRQRAMPGAAPAGRARAERSTNAD